MASKLLQRSLHCRIKKLVLSIRNLSRFTAEQSLKDRDSIFTSLRPYLSRLVQQHESQQQGEEIRGSKDTPKINKACLRHIADLVQRLATEEQYLNECLSLAESPELKDLAQKEIQEHKNSISNLKEELLTQLLETHKDYDDINSAVIEVRAGAGGLEASLFTAEMFQMYQKYAIFNGWDFELLSISETDLGGYRNASASINGRGVFGTLKFEIGVHRVQRIPVTASKGRMHTSTMTVAILPQPTEVQLKLNEKDVKIETFKAGGPGGQYVNTTDSAVRVIHLPTGIVVKNQDERSQHMNKAKALKLLKVRLYEMERKIVEEERAQQRSQQIGSGERHERIRTYNYLQDRITDHRIGLSVQGVRDFMSGTDMLQNMIEALQQHSNTQLLLQLSSHTDFNK